MEDQSFEGPEKRKFFRVKYIPSAGPTIRIGNHDFEVVDISERGLQFLNDKNVKFAEWIRGTLTFSDREALVIEGRIIWRGGAKIGLKLVTPIPYVRILKEQRYQVDVS